MTAAPVQPPMIYFGGKTRLARRIAALLPRQALRRAFGCSLAALFAKAPSRLETVSDVDGDLIYLDIASIAVW